MVGYVSFKYIDSYGWLLWFVMSHIFDIKKEIHYLKFPAIERMQLYLVSTDIVIVKIMQVNHYQTLQQLL